MVGVMKGTINVIYFVFFNFSQPSLIMLRTNKVAPSININIYKHFYKEVKVFDCCHGKTLTTPSKSKKQTKKCQHFFPPNGHLPFLNVKKYILPEFDHQHYSLP